MAAVNYLQSVAEKMISSCEARQKDMYEREHYVADLLGQISKNRSEMAKVMWKELAETSHNRQVEVNKMLKELTHIRMESWQSWAKAVHTMNVIRAGKIDSKQDGFNTKPSEGHKDHGYDTRKKNLKPMG